ncbi:MAG: FAD-dependent monooxygenase [Oscillospiraceae bacterium]|nr:FAD-dependent monooxygenase [Oscillospiraceae bacterium]
MEIIVAGAGHGGLAAAGLLAKAGHSVTVYECKSEAEVGHDWTDICDPAAFLELGIDTTDAHWEQCEHMAFYCPNAAVGVDAFISEEMALQPEMDRKYIARKLLAFARENGAAVKFEAAVTAPLYNDRAVTGVRVRYKNNRTYDKTAALVIDAAGMESPVRRNLPPQFGIKRIFGASQHFNVYRAFYAESGETPTSAYPFSVYFYPGCLRGIAWVNRSRGIVDFLLGTFEGNGPEAVECAIDSLAARHPELSGRIVRGGQFATIPVRRVLPKFVEDGYAAVGDSAAMTIPINGAGITNSLRAGRFLAEQVLSVYPDGKAPAPVPVPVEVLWNYQVRYFTEIGARQASLDVFKSFLLSSRPADLDAMFADGIFTPEAMVPVRTGDEIDFTVPEMVATGIKGARHPLLLMKVTNVLARSKMLKAIALRIPKTYDAERIGQWMKDYAVFR